MHIRYRVINSIAVKHNQSQICTRFKLSRNFAETVNVPCKQQYIPIVNVQDQSAQVGGWDESILGVNNKLHILLKA